MGSTQNCIADRMGPVVTDFLLNFNFSKKHMFLKIMFVRPKNGPIRSAIKFCVDPIFVASELIGNRTSYDQNIFYIFKSIF